MLNRIFIIALFIAVFSANASAQLFGSSERQAVITRNGREMAVMIQGTDTIAIAGLDEVEIKGARLFRNEKDRIRYTQMRYNAKKVLPYVVEAVKLFEDIQADTKDMKSGKKIRRVNDVQKELQSRFEKPLKSLYRSQGLILVQMIERETNRSLYSILDEYKGGLSALYWQTLGSFYQFDLRETYDPTKDPMLESVLREFDVKTLVAQKRAQEGVFKTTK